MPWRTVGSTACLLLSTLTACHCLRGSLTPPSRTRVQERSGTPEARNADQEIAQAQSPARASLSFPPAIRIERGHEVAIDRAVERAIRTQHVPGVAVVLGRRDGVVFRRAYGARSVEPTVTPLFEDAIFDLASVTKLFTTVLVWQRIEAGALSLGDDVGRWISPLRGITVEQLLTHSSGLPAVTALESYAIDDRRSALQAVFEDAARARSVPGRYRYSDVGFIALGELISQLAGQPLEDVVEEAIVTKLGLADTGFRPAVTARVVPSERAPRRAAPGSPPPIVHGETLDPRAWRLDGVAGNAGLFASADDLARFAQALMANELLSEATHKRMATPRDLAAARRGLGVDMNTPPGMSAASYGHGGYTGVWVWIDPVRDVYVVVASHRVHPDARGRVGALRSQVARIASEAVPNARAQPRDPPAFGIDVLRAQNYAMLEGQRIGLLTHAAAVARDGRRTVDLFQRSEHVALVRVFTPEHGLDADQEGHVHGAVLRSPVGLEGMTPDLSVPVVSLYGRQRDPPAAALADLDAMVVDIQDVGARFYTYFATMGRVLRACAERGIPVVVLDRPNPLGGQVAGPMSTTAVASFVNHHPLPMLHGMTAAEMARWIRERDELNVEIRPVAMQSWSLRGRWTADGLRWVAPSPNLSSLEAVTLYPAVALLEGANVSVGRGTAHPFGRVGAPWMDAEAVRRALPPALSGVSVEVESFTPDAGPFRGQRCHGLRFHAHDLAAVRPVTAGFALLIALHQAHPDQFELQRTLGMVGDDEILTAIAAGASVEELANLDPAHDFAHARETALLYAGHPGWQGSRGRNAPAD